MCRFWCIFLEQMTEHVYVTSPVSFARDVHYLLVILLWFSTFRGATRAIEVKLQVSNKSIHTLNVFIVPLCILWLFPWCIVDQLTYNTLCSPEKTSPRKTLTAVTQLLYMPSAIQGAIIEGDKTGNMRHDKIYSNNVGWVGQCTQQQLTSDILSAPSVPLQGCDELSGMEVWMIQRRQNLQQQEV